MNESIFEHPLLGSVFRCQCKLTHKIPVKFVVLSTDAIVQVPEIIHKHDVSDGVYLLADDITYDVAGRQIEKSLKRKGMAPNVFILSHGLCANDVNAEIATQNCPSGSRIIISCGSGTVTDIAKWVAFKKKIPHIAVATAPSMNGYASGIVALTENGLKTTRAVNPPLAVIADIDILKNAPMEMIRAGLGDVLSKSVCNADWKLASILKGDHFCLRPFELIKSLDEIDLNMAKLIAKRDPAAIKTLTEALVVSGLSMVLAGSSAPASGGEHLISHFIDMRAWNEKRPHDLHGAQVGVATIATAELYEKLIKLSVRDLNRDALASAWDRSQKAISECKKLFRKTGHVIEAEANKKWGDKTGVRAVLASLPGRWEAIKDELRMFLVSGRQIRSALDSAGAKVHYADIGLKPQEFRDAIRLSMCIRSRYTVLDLAFALGLLDDFADEVTTEAKP